MTEIEALRVLFEIGQEITEKGLITQDKAFEMGEAIGVLSVAVQKKGEKKK